MKIFFENLKSSAVLMYVFRIVKMCDDTPIIHRFCEKNVFFSFFGFCSWFSLHFPLVFFVDDTRIGYDLQGFLSGNCDFSGVTWFFEWKLWFFGRNMIFLSGFLRFCSIIIYFLRFFRFFDVFYLFFTIFLCFFDVENGFFMFFQLGFMFFWGFKGATLMIIFSAVFLVFFRLEFVFFLFFLLADTIFRFRIFSQILLEIILAGKNGAPFFPAKMISNKIWENILNLKIVSASKKNKKNTNSSLKNTKKTAEKIIIKVAPLKPQKNIKPSWKNMKNPFSTSKKHKKIVKNK